MTENGISYADMERYILMMYKPDQNVSVQVDYHCSHDIPPEEKEVLRDSLALAFFTGQKMLGKYQPFLLRYAGISITENMIPQSILVLQDTDPKTEEMLALLLSSPRIEPIDVCEKVVELGKYACQEYGEILLDRGVKRGQVVKFEETLETYSLLLNYLLDQAGYSKESGILTGQFTPVFLVEKSAEKKSLALYTFPEMGEAVSDEEKEIASLIKLRPPSMFVNGLEELNNRFQINFFTLMRDLDPNFPPENSVRLDAIGLRKKEGKGEFAYVASYLSDGRTLLLGLSETQNKEYLKHPLGSMHNITSLLMGRAVEKERAVERQDPVSFLLEKIPYFKNKIEIKDINSGEGQDELMGAWE